MTPYKYQKITNLLDATPDNVPRFITIKSVEVQDESGSAEDRYKPSLQIRFKTSMLRSDLCVLVMHILLLKELLLLQKQMQEVLLT